MPPYPRCDERPPPRQAPRGGFNERFCEPEIAPPCPARGPEAGSAQRYPSVLCFSWFGCEHFVHVRFNNPARYARYTATDTTGSGMSSPLQVRGESSSCSGTPDDCKPCHFVFDGDIYAGGMMVFNGSAGADQRWIVVFTRMPGGENGIWHTRSITQTESGCVGDGYRGCRTARDHPPDLRLFHERCGRKKRDAVCVLRRVGIRSLAAC